MKNCTEAMLDIPGAAMQIMKVEKQVIETKEVLHRTLEAVLARGEKIDDLVAKSEKLSKSSKLFYDQTRITRCCEIM